MEEFEDLKRTVANMMSNREVSEDVIKIISEIRPKILEIYRTRRLDTESIQEYVYSQFEVLKASIRDTSKNKNEQDFQEVMFMLDTIKRQEEEKVENSKKENGLNAIIFDDDDDRQVDEEQDERIQVQMNKSRIESASFDNRKPIERIAVELEDYIKSVRNMGTRTLGDRGVSERTIDEIYLEMTELVRKCESYSIEKICPVLDDTDKEMLKEIANQYEMYEEKKNRSKTKHQEFAEGLNAGMSLEEQHKNALEFEENANSNDKSRKALPDHVID